MVQANRDLPLVPSFSVKLNGRPLLPEMSMWIVSVVVEDELDLPGMFTLQLISKETEQGSTPWSDDPRLELGATVEVSLGWNEDHDSLMVGEIVSLEPTFSSDGPPSLLVRGFDLRHRLNGVRRTRSFVDKTDAGIAELIGSDAGVDIQATDSRVTHPYVMQADQTDLEFLRERARRIQYELAMDGKTMLFRPAANTGSSIATLTLRDDLFEFRPRLSLVPVTGIQVLGWDPKEKLAIRSAAPADSGDRVETLVRTPFATQAEADQFAVAAFNDASLEFVRGEGRVRGRTDVRAGRVIQLDEIGGRFGGAYYVTSVVHRYSPEDSYVTEFRARRAAS